jgi:hypothetical protein
VPRMNSQRSLTEAVRMSVGSTPRPPKDIITMASHQQIMYCTALASYLHNLQVGSAFKQTHGT